MMKSIRNEKASVENMECQREDSIVIPKQASVPVEVSPPIEAVHHYTEWLSRRILSAAGSYCREQKLLSKYCIQKCFLFSQFLSSIQDTSVLSSKANSNLPLNSFLEGCFEAQGQDHGQRLSLPITHTAGKPILFLPGIPGRRCFYEQTLLYLQVTFPFSNFFWSGAVSSRNTGSLQQLSAPQTHKKYSFLQMQFLNYFKTSSL